jgi:hypothetical protein
MKSEKQQYTDPGIPVLFANWAMKFGLIALGAFLLYVSWDM